MACVWVAIFLAVDSDGAVYVAELSHRIRKVFNGTTTTLAGNSTPGFLDGPAATAMFGAPADVALDRQGNLIVADTSNHRVRVVLLH